MQAAPPPPPAFRATAKPAPRPVDQAALRLGINWPGIWELRPRHSLSPQHSLSRGPVAPSPEPPKVLADLDIAADVEAAMPVWEQLQPAATEPHSFEPQEALDIMDETADEFGDEAAEETAVSAESGGETPTEEQRSRRRRRRRGRGRGRESVGPAEARAPGDSGEVSRDEEFPAEEDLSRDADQDAETSTGETAVEELPEGERTDRRGRRPRGRGRSASHSR